MAVNSAARMWSPFKELFSTVEAAIQRKQPDAIQDLEVALRKHKPDFITLLQNPPKNSAHRQAVQKANTEGLPVQGQPTKQTLSKPFIEEALIISDLFNLNEFAAVELLLDGETQQSHFPGLPRGLVAVLLYYDGRASLVNALRSLLQAQSGLAWAADIPDVLANLITNFTDQLIAEGLVQKILGLLKKMNVTTESERLEKDCALGPPRHRRQVLDKLEEIRTSLTDSLFSVACQARLSTQDTLHAIGFLRGHSAMEADGTMDGVGCGVLMALLYCFDLSYLETNETEEAGRQLPIISEQNFVADVHQELSSSHPWKVEPFRAVLQFAWAVTLRTLSQYTALNLGISDYCEYDDQLMDLAIDGDVFPFLRNSLVAKEAFHKEQFYVSQLHQLLTTFIVQMPLKVKELRNRGDETARIIVAHQREGVEPPQGPRRDFEHMLNLMSELYSKEPYGGVFAANFWCSPDTLPSSTSGLAALPRTPDIQISLNKFVRLAGDLLPPPLYIPYINMLAGLANSPTAAHHTYNLLKANGQTSGGSVSTVAWEHFFLSLNQYYSCLRQEAPVASDLAHVYRLRGGGANVNVGSGITQQETDGLVAWLRLTKVVALHDEGARLAMCDNQQWLPLVVLLGLVACPVTPRLKAGLLDALAAFAKTPEIAANLWQAIENAQVIPTVSRMSQATSLHRHSPGGLQVELDEVEARNEEFPMTLAFLRLVSALTDTPIPAGLGTGYRAPGFTPYLDFLRDSVFLKFNTRAYKNPAEKWEVAASVLEILHKLLAAHEVYREDFLDVTVETPGEGTSMANKPPGHVLMVHMLNDSGLLRMVLYIIDEATKQLNKYINFPGKSSLERASELCLQMVEQTLGKQEVFLAALRETASSTMVNHMDKLLLGINPRSGRADHLTNIATYVTYSNALPHHALSAVRILHVVSQSALVQPKLVGLFTASPDAQATLLHGFVECLEADEAEDDEDDEQQQQGEGTSQGYSNDSAARSQTRQTIMRLLLATLDQPTPNLAHFLLGFNLNKPVSKTNLQDPGVLGSPRTCLHSVLSLLDRGVDQRTGPACLYLTPALAQLAYHLIYKLCANKDTSNPTMRYLRTTHDFFQRHLHHVPFTPPQGISVSPSTLLNQQSWFLKSLAIELRLTSSNRQRSHTQRLLNLILDDNPALQQKVLGPDGVYEPDYSQYDTEFSLFNTTSQMQYNQAVMGGQSRRKILSLLDSIELSQEYPSALELEFLNPALVQQAVQAREQRSEQGVVFCNVRGLHAAMMAELNNNQAANTGHRKLIVQEIAAICQNIVERNAFREALHSKRQALEAWRQVVEIILTACPADLLTGDTRHNVLLELLQDLLLKVSREGAIPELASSVAGVVLTLMANLRQCFLGDQDQTHLTHFSTSLLDAPTNQGAGFGQVTGARTMYASSLQVVLKGLVDFLIGSSSSSQRVRADLYGALLYFLQIAQKPKNIDTDRSQGVGSRLTGKESEYDKLTSENVATLAGYGDNLMDIVCRDACDGHDVCRMLSLGCLDALLGLERRSQWLTFLSGKGYLLHIIESLTQDDQQLQAMLQPQPEPLKALYIFESKMGLLTRVGRSASGAHMLLQCGLMARLSECSVFDLRPEADTHTEGFIPNILKRYRYQILFPVLKLCLAVLTSLGIENKQGGMHVLKFIVAHVDVFNSILRERAASQLNLEALQELSLVTAVISRAATEDGDTDSLLGETAVIEFKSHLSRLQRQMIELLPKYCLTEKLLKQIQGLEVGGGMEAADRRIKIQLAVEEVACNVTAFCRGIVSKSGSSTGSSIRLLFSPSLDAPACEEPDFPAGGAGGMSAAAALGRPQSLGLIVFLLRQASTLFLAAFEQNKQTQRKLHTVADLGVEELKELCEGSSSSSSSAGDGGNSEKMSSQQRQQIARCRLAQLLHYKQTQLQLFSYIVENCLFLLWRHLDFYLVHCVATETGMSLFRLNQRQQQMRRLQDSPSVYGDSFYGGDDSGLEGSASVSAGVSKEQLDALRQAVPHAINESLLTRLADIEQCYSRDRTRYGFMEALIRRIKRLIKLHTS